MFILITLHISNCDLFFIDACRLSIMLFDVLQSRESRGTARKECRIWNKARLCVQKWHLRQRLLRDCLCHTIQCTSWKSLPTLEAAHRVTEIWLGVSSELCFGSLHVFYLSKQVGAIFKFPTWTRIERRIRNRARRRRLWYLGKSLQTLWMSSVSLPWGTFCFLRKSSVTGSLQYCYGSVASVLHCDIIVVLNAKVRFDVSFIYKS